MAVNSAVLKGVTTVVWGTLSKLSAPAGAIVDAIDITPKNPNPIQEIENGDGAAVTDVMLDDGFDAKVTCVYDSAKTWPVTNGSVTLTVPGKPGSPFTCFVTGDPQITLGRKKEAMISFNLRYRPGIA